MNFLSKKTRNKLMAQALVATSVLGMGTGYNFVFTAPIQVNAESYKTTINGILYSYNTVYGTAYPYYADCPNITGNITVPSTVVIDGRTYTINQLGSCAFQYCTGLTSVTLPSAIKDISLEAFKGCTGLTSVTIPYGIGYIEQGAYRDCKNLTSVTIPSTITSIEGYTFKNCTSLTSVTIPSSVTSIDYYAFSDCTNLTSVYIQNGNAVIESRAFSGDNKITTYGLGSKIYTLNQTAKTATLPAGTPYAPATITFNGDVYTVIVSDTTVPTLTLSASTTSPTNGSVTITATGSDNVGVASITKPDSTVVNGSSTTYTVSANGTYTFTVKDKAGNTVSQSITVSNIDKTAPVITLGSYDTSPTNGNITVTASTNEGTLNATSHTFTSNGSFNFVATDSAGNVTTKPVTINNIDSVAITAVVKAEGSKLQADVTSAQTLVTALANGTYKTSLQTRLDIVEATNAVIKAENSKLQADVDSATPLVNAVSNINLTTKLLNVRLTMVQTYINNVADATTKVATAESTKSQANVDIAQTAINVLPTGDANRVSLQTRLDVVKAYITYQTQLANATSAVVKAEGSKLQADVDSAKTLVNALPTGTDKTNLTNRLNVIQSAIDKVNQDSLNLADATTKVVNAENTKTQANVDLAQTAINLLLTGTDKTSLQSRLDTVKGYIAQLATATSAVVKAESSKLQADIDSAKPLVNALTDGIDKTDLLIRLNKIIPNSGSNTTNITNATNAVVKAEGSKLQADVDSAKTLVDSLTDSVSKTNLTNRLNAVQTYINNVIDATNKVVTAENTKTKANVDIAQNAINKLTYGKDKSALQARLNLVITDINNSTNSSSALNTTETLVKLAESMKRNPYIANAQTAVSKLVDSAEKTAFQVRLDKLKASTSGGSTGGSTTTNSATALNTTGLTVRLAESMKREPYITQAQNAINKLFDSTEKTAFQVRLDKVKASINTGGTGTPGQTTNSATALNTTGITVSLAESMKRDPYITNAQNAINKLVDGTEKTAFQVRLDKVKASIGTGATPVQPVYSTSTLKQVETSVGLAESMKRDPYITQAQTAIDKLADSAEKTAFQERLDKIKNPVVVDTKLAEATTAVVQAEKFKYSYYTNKATTIVTALPDSQDKTDLLTRIANIK